MQIIRQVDTGTNLPFEHVVIVGAATAHAAPPYGGGGADGQQLPDGMCLAVGTGPHLETIRAVEVATEACDDCKVERDGIARARRYLEPSGSTSSKESGMSIRPFVPVDEPED
jgi:hypothetical protein